MHSSTYVASRPGSFSALVQAAEIDDFRLDPLLPTHLRDQYFDTAEGRLLREGLALRLREADGRRTVGLRAVSGGDVRQGLPPDVDLPPGGGDLFDLPPGPLARAIWDRVEAAHLRPLLTLRQYRTPRIATRGDQSVAMVAFDVVVYEVPGSQEVSNEVEVEYSEWAQPPVAAALDAALRAKGLEPVERSRFERGVLRLPQRLSDPVLLLPDERRRLGEAVEAADTPTQRRALAILLDAEGYRPDIIATQTGLSLDRVRHWKQQFREVRMHILKEAPPSPPIRPSGTPGFQDATRDPVSPPRSPAAEAPAPPSDPRPPAPSFGGMEGDGASSPLLAPDDPLGVQDVAELLDAFTPSNTATPLFDDGPLSEDADALEEEGQDGGDMVPSSRQRLVPDVASLAPSKSYPVILGPLAAPSPDRLHAQEPAFASEPPDQEEEVGKETPLSPSPELEGAPAAGSAADHALPARRPILRGDASLLHAAQATVAYYIAAFEGAAARLADAPGALAEADVRRVLIAAHRVRLSLESFRPVLPSHAADRLMASLRLLVADLDEWLDASHVVQTAPSAEEALAGRRARAAVAIAKRLQGGRQRAWGARALRLLARLADQRAEGLLLGDDFPPPPDDFVGEPGDVPAPTRLRHVLSSMLWARYEAVRAFEDDLSGPVDSSMVYHLTIAVSGLHFVLGLAGRASAGPVQDVAEILDAAEAELAAYRHAARTAELVAETGAEPVASPDLETIRQTWQTLTRPNFREQLAAVAAAI